MFSVLAGGFWASHPLKAGFWDSHNDALNSKNDWWRTKKSQTWYNTHKGLATWFTKYCTAKCLNQPKGSMLPDFCDCTSQLKPVSSSSSAGLGFTGSWHPDIDGSMTYY